MPKIQFIGRVLPTVAGVTAQLPEITWPWIEKGIDLKFKININHSIVNAECEVPQYDPTYALELMKMSIDLARVAVDVVAFASGYCLTISMEVIIEPDGIPKPMLFTDPRGCGFVHGVRT